MFSLHPQLAQDTFLVGHFPLCQLLMMNDSRYPWFILVPQREGITELHHLTADDQRQLTVESNHLSSILAERFAADKMNVAALGNVVPQLHIHHIARFRDDPAWPHPVWGHLTPIAYAPEQAEARLNKLRPALGVGFRH